MLTTVSTLYEDTLWPIFEERLPFFPPHFGLDHYTACIMAVGVNLPRACRAHTGIIRLRSSQLHDMNTVVGGVGL